MNFYTRKLIKPEDLNPRGTLFGGRLLQWIDEEAAVYAMCQLETKDIVNTLLSDRTIGIPCKYDIIYDGTMNSTKSYLPLIELLKKLGYKIFIVYIDKVEEEVIKKAKLFNDFIFG
jgi:hypothetical protein